MALSCVVFEIFNVEKCRDLELQVTGHSRSLKVVPFDVINDGYVMLRSASGGRTYA